MEHEHHSESEHHHEIHSDLGHHAHQHQSKFSISASILIGSVLISISIFYNTNVLIKAFGGSVGNRVQGSSQQAGAEQAAGAGSGAQASVPERADAPSIGKDNAKVTLIEFADFQCPFCQSFYKNTYAGLKSKYIDSGKVRFVFRHFPLPFHQNAQKAGEAAECANRQGKFEAYHDVLFEKSQADGRGLAIADLKKYASDLNLDTGKFNACLDKGETAEVVKKDLAAGTAAGVSGTPTFFLNGKRIVGAQASSAFEAAIEEALKK